MKGSPSLSSSLLHHPHCIWLPYTDADRKRATPAQNPVTDQEVTDDSQPQLANLISRHSSLVVLFDPTIRERLLRHGEDLVPGQDQLITEESRLRDEIIAWAPQNISEARAKLEHLASFIAATGVSFDAETLDAILQSVVPFT